jgi:endoglucanase
MSLNVAARLLTTTIALLGVGLNVCRAGEAQAPFPWPKAMRGVNIILGHITEADLAHLASDWKANSVRLMAESFLANEPPYAINTEKLKRLDEVVGWCRKHGLSCVINVGQPQERNGGWFWQTSGAQEKFVELWQSIAGTYAQSGPGVAYDLMNEPHGNGAAEVWPRLVGELTAAIRKLDQVHPIVVEPPPWGNAEGFVDLKPLTADANTVYSFHFYEPFDFTHQRGAAGTLRAKPEDHPLGLHYPGRIKAFWRDAPVEEWNRDTIRARVAPVVKFRDTYKVPVWCGEFGCTRWADGAPQYMTDCLDTWEELGIGWAWYSYREWYAMDLEQGTEDRSRQAPRFESDLVKLFKRYFARNPQPEPPPGGAAPKE